MNDISEADFADLISQKLTSAGDSRVARFDADEFRIVFTEEDAECGVLNLGNLYAEFLRLPVENREQRISEIARAALSHLKPMPEEFVDASYDLRPRLWARSTFETMRIRQQIESGKEPNWPVEPVGSHLILSLVFDLPESVRSVSGDELEAWGISFWQAREIAIENLAKEDFVMASLGEALYASNTCDSYDATRLVLSAFTDQLQIEGEMIAMVPNRDTLLLSGDESEVGIKMMVELAAQELSENPRPLVAAPLIYRDDHWQDWSVPVEHPSYNLFRKCYLGWLQHEYSNQKELLEELNQAKMIDEFVASFTVIEKDDTYSSYSVWGKDVKTSLPKTDNVAFISSPGGKDIVWATWDQAIEVCGDIMEEQDRYPPRFLVDEFPSAEQLKQFASLKTD